MHPTTTCICVALLMQPIFAAKSLWQTIRAHHKTRPSLQDLKPTPDHYGYKELNYRGEDQFDRHLRTNGMQDLGLRSQDMNDSSSDFKPLRIKFVTEPLTSLLGGSDAVDAKISAVLNDVLPMVENTWMTHLSVVPVEDPIPVRRDDCFGIYNDLIPQQFLDDGVDGADLVVFVSGKDTLTTGSGQQVNVCGQGTLAVATSCSLDQFDRPIMGFINFCIPALSRQLEEADNFYPKVELSDMAVKSANEENSLISNEVITNTKLVATHEVGHVLGVDSDLYLFFRDPETGEPRTPRPFQEKTVDCVDGSRETRPFPDSNTLASEVSSQGQLYYNLVTPRVQTVVRNHFNCQSLPGARLENQPTGPSCTGAHFDERLFYSELMGPIFSGTADILSPLTLALLDDSGWYKVSYEGSEVSPFGHGAGCSFVNDDCIVDDEVPTYGEGAFCSQVTQLVGGQISAVSSDLLCDPTHRSIGVCDLFDRDSTPFNFDPNGIQYFSDTSLQALTAQNDWCPVAGIPTGVDCSDESGDQLQASYVGEEYGPNSRCVNFEPNVSGRAVAGCFKIECDAVNRRVVVNGETCESDGQRIAVPTTSGFATSNMICPKLAVVCLQMFCQGGCSGRGTCNFETNECECFDPQDASPICSGGLEGSFTLSPTPSPARSDPSAVTTTTVVWTTLAGVGVVTIASFF